MNQIDGLLSLLPAPFRGWLSGCRDAMEKATEIRFRVGRHVAVACGGETFFVDEQGLSGAPRAASPPLGQRELVEIVTALCEYSVFSHSESLREGFLTISGGHRVGVCTSVNRQGAADLGSVNSINIRVANEQLGCAKRLSEVIGPRDGSLLLCGPPLSGKTTVLRDYARIVSDGPFFEKCVLIDERGELAAMRGGISPFRLGECTDVIDRFARSKAFDVALRTLSPQLLVCDELGTQEDLTLLAEGAKSGIRLLASAHAANLDDLRRKTDVWRAVEAGLFDTVAFLSGAPRIGELQKIYKVV